MTDLNENFRNCMPNSWSKQAYVQVFDCEYTTFNKAVNMFEHIEISESIYEGSLKKILGRMPPMLVTANLR